MLSSDWMKPGPVIFKASAKNHLASMRKWLWGSVLMTLVFMGVTRTAPLNILLWTAGIAAVFCALMDWVFRRQLKPGQALVTLHEDGIESTSFPGKLLWKDLTGASIVMMNNFPTLQFQLLYAPGRVDRRTFWTGRNPAKPHIVLTPFSAADQELLFAEVQRHLQQVVPHAVVHNPLVHERKFQEQLNALAPHTWMTYAMVAINVGMWGAMVALGADVLKPSVELLLGWGGNAAFNVQQGQLWRLLSASFLHSGIVHLAMNMLGLWVIGQTVERIYGHRVFLLIYLGSAFLASAFSLHYSAQRAVSVGASGAVFGIAGALLVAVLQHRKTLPKLFGKQMLSGMGFFILYSLLQGFAKTGIDNAAHVGGLMAGALMALILPERFDMPRFVAQVRWRAMAALTVIACVTSGMVVIAPAGAVDLQRAYAGQRDFERSVKELDLALKSFRQDVQLAKKGDLPQAELDQRVKVAHLPALSQVEVLLSKTWLPPDDVRQPWLQESRRFVSLLVESLAMDSVAQPGNPEPQPVDPARWQVLQVDLKKSADRLPGLAAQAIKAAQSR